MRDGGGSQGWGRSCSTSAGWARCVCPSRVWSSWSGRCGHPVGTPSSRSEWSCRKRRKGGVGGGVVSARTDRLKVHQAVNMFLFLCFVCYNFCNHSIPWFCCWWVFYPGNNNTRSPVLIPHEYEWIWIYLFRRWRRVSKFPLSQHQLLLFWLPGFRWAASHRALGVCPPPPPTPTWSLLQAELQINTDNPLWNSLISQRRTFMALKGTNGSSWGRRKENRLGVCKWFC